MRPLARFVACGLAPLALVGCGAEGNPPPSGAAPVDDPCAPAGSFAPGDSVTLCGVTLRLGDEVPSALSGLGLPTTTHDLGSDGSRLAWPDHGVTAYMDTEGAILALHLLPGYEVAADASVAFGASAAEVEAALGVATVEPFLGLWQYPELGLALQWSGDEVGGVHILPPSDPVAPVERPEGSGGALPDLSLSTCDGEPRQLGEVLAGQKGGWIGVQAGWCGSCGSQREVMQALHEQLGDAGLAVILVLGEDATPGSGQVPEAWCDQFVTANGLTFTVLRDPGFAATGAWAGAVVPAQLIVDAELQLLQHDVGWADWMEDAYASLLSELVATW